MAQPSARFGADAEATWLLDEGRVIPARLEVNFDFLPRKAGMHFANVWGKYLGPWTELTVFFEEVRGFAIGGPVFVTNVLFRHGKTREDSIEPEEIFHFRAWIYSHYVSIRIHQGLVRGSFCNERIFRLGCFQRNDGGMVRERLGDLGRRRGSFGESGGRNR